MGDYSYKTRKKQSNKCRLPKALNILKHQINFCKERQLSKIAI
jgi:hypothetical protein